MLLILRWLLLSVGVVSTVRLLVLGLVYRGVAVGVSALCVGVAPDTLRVRTQDGVVVDDGDRLPVRTPGVPELDLEVENDAVATRESLWRVNDGVRDQEAVPELVTS